MTRAGGIKASLLATVPRGPCERASLDSAVSRLLPHLRVLLVCKTCACGIVCVWRCVRVALCVCGIVCASPVILLLAEASAAAFMF